MTQKEIWLREEEMTKAILDYLAELPLASDTLEGIAEWWIMRRQIRVEVNKLRKVLDQLIERGFLERIGEGDNARYRLKAERVALRSKDERRK